MNAYATSTLRPCCRQESQNVGNPERLGSALAGGALLLCALRPKFLPGPVWTFAGATIAAGLLTRAATGHCAIYRRMGINTVDRQDAPAPPPVYRDAPPMGEEAALAVTAPTVESTYEPAIEPAIGQANEPTVDPVDEASRESFPASDPPSSIVTGTG